MGLFRRRFGDLVARQLDLFAADHADELAELGAATAERRRALAEDDHRESFGDEQDRVDWVTASLLAIRDTYARGVAEDQVEAYERAFTRAARRRFPALASAIDSEDVG